MEARISSGESGSPGVSLGFSTKALIFPRLSGSVSMTPNWSAKERGWRMPATVHGRPEAMWWSSIWEKSMR